MKKLKNQKNSEEFVFFSLQYVDDHPCCKLQDVIENFFRESINSSEYGVHLFPEWYRDTISNSPALNSDFESLFQDIQSKNINFRQKLYDQILNNNNICEICNDITFQIDDEINWNSRLGLKIKNFFNERLYKALDSSVFKPPGANQKPKKSYYNKFIELNKYVCPFCGINSYPNRLSRYRSDFDHYMDKGKYPFAVANTKNIVPMCDSCNQDYKGIKNVVINNEQRTFAFYPYDNFPDITFKIVCLNEPDATNNRGSWDVLFSYDQNIMQKIENWDRVFDIKNRIIEEIMEYYDYWMTLFYDNNYDHVINDLSEFKQLLLNYSNRFNNQIRLRMEAKIIITKEFYRFMAEDASEAFIRSYLRSFNHMFNEAN